MVTFFSPRLKAGPSHHQAASQSDTRRARSDSEEDIDDARSGKSGIPKGPVEFQLCYETVGPKSALSTGDGGCSVSHVIVHDCADGTLHRLSFQGVVRLDGLCVLWMRDNDFAHTFQLRPCCI